MTQFKKGDRVWWFNRYASFGPVTRPAIVVRVGAHKITVRVDFMDGVTALRVVMPKSLKKILENPD